MTDIVILALVITVVALVVKRNLLVLAAASVIVGGELLVKSNWFSDVSVIILAGCAQLLLYMGCKTVFKEQVGRSSRLQLFTKLALFCAVLSCSKLVGFLIISNATVHDGYQWILELALEAATITMAFLLLLSPPHKVSLHELGRNIWNSFIHNGSHSHTGHTGE